MWGLLKKLYDSSMHHATMSSLPDTSIKDPLTVYYQRIAKSYYTRLSPGISCISSMYSQRYPQKMWISDVSEYNRKLNTNEMQQGVSNKLGFNF
jgi:hypothetical protein